MITNTDVIIIGAGLAGMIAACAAEAEGARVLLLDRSALGLGTNSALFERGLYRAHPGLFGRGVRGGHPPDRPGPEPEILGGAGGPGSAPGHRIPEILRSGNQDPLEIIFPSSPHLPAPSRE